MHETPNAWDQAYFGIGLLHEEARQLEPILSRLFGYHMGIVGDTLFSHYANSSLIQHRVLVNRSDAYAESCALIRGQYNQLPIASEAMDVVLLPHTLESVKQPEYVMRDATRILRPNGYLIITGANPFSWIGMRYELDRVFKKGLMYRWPSVNECRQWCAWLDLEIDRIDYYYYQVPFSKKAIQQPHNSILKNITPQYGGYLLVAIKRQAGVTPIRASWNRRRTAWVNNEVPIS